MICHSDRLSDPMLPRIKLINTLTILRRLQMWTLFLRCFWDLTWWSTFWPHLTQILTHPRFHLHKQSKFKKTGSQAWSLSHLQSFYMIWSSDLFLSTCDLDLTLSENSYNELLWPNLKKRLGRRCGLYHVNNIFLWFYLVT